MTLLSRRRFALLLASLCLALLTPVLAHADLMRAIQARSGLMDEILLQADQPRYSNEVWVLIDKQASSLSLYRGNTLLERFSPISLGRGGAETQRLRGGRVTPLGEFRVTRFNFDSKFHTFIGLDYPTPLMHAWRCRPVSTASENTTTTSPITAGMVGRPRIRCWAGISVSMASGWRTRISIAVSTGRMAVSRSPMAG